jgi:hypothetical protein
MLIPNVLFRANGSAVLLSNTPRDARRAKYAIRNVVRTHLASDDVAYNCVIQMEDADGNVSAARVRRRVAGAVSGVRACRAVSCCVVRRRGGVAAALPAGRVGCRRHAGTHPSTS